MIRYTGRNISYITWLVSLIQIPAPIAFNLGGVCLPILSKNNHVETISVTRNVYTPTHTTGNGQRGTRKR